MSKRSTQTFSKEEKQRIHGHVQTLTKMYQGRKEEDELEDSYDRMLRYTRERLETKQDAADYFLDDLLQLITIECPGDRRERVELDDPILDESSNPIRRIGEIGKVSTLDCKCISNSYCHHNYNQMIQPSKNLDLNLSFYFGNQMKSMGFSPIGANIRSKKERLYSLLLNII